MICYSERTRCLAVLDELANQTESAAAKVAYMIAAKRIKGEEKA